MQLQTNNDLPTDYSTTSERILFPIVVVESARILNLDTPEQLDTILRALRRAQLRRLGRVLGHPWV